MIAFHKYQALGNDYVVVEAAALTPAQVRRICAPHWGLGADGVLLPDGNNPFRVTIYNPDGSVAEKSGNGLRIYARYLFDGGYVADQSFRIATNSLASDAGADDVQVLDNGAQVRLTLGRVRVVPQPLLLTVAGQTLAGYVASVGNPHCVILWPQSPTADDARLFGPAVEVNPAFPDRTNVQFAYLRSRTMLQLQIWERGAGYTLASGTSSCAAVAVAHALGLCDAAVTVQMPGGPLAVQLDEQGRATITGPVTRIALGHLDPALFAAAGTRDSYTDLREL